MFGGKITLTVLTCHSLLESTAEAERSVVDPVFEGDNNDDDDDDDEDDMDEDEERDAESDAADEAAEAAADADEG